MKLTVRYFASFREALGPTESIELAASTTVDEVRAALMARSRVHATILAADQAVCSALNHVMCQGQTRIPVEVDAELAFFPPVTGG